MPDSVHGQNAEVETPPTVNGLLTIDDLDLRTNYTKHAGINGNSVTFGDMHGNALKMLCCLKLAGVIELTDEQHQRAVDIYEKEDDLTSEDYEAYKKVLKHKDTKFNTDMFIRWAGDNYGDRGKDDGLIFITLDVLDEKGVDSVEAFSNHGLDFFMALKENNLESVRLEDRDTRSLSALKRAIDSGALTHEYIKDVVDRVCLPKLKLVSAESEAGRLSFFTHAPATPESIASVMRQYGIRFEAPNPDPVQHFLDQCDAINWYFQQVILKQPLSSHFHENQGVVEGCEPESWRPDYLADSKLAWMRWVPEAALSSFARFGDDVAVVNVHGHTGVAGARMLDAAGSSAALPGKYQGNFACLDSDWGKGVGEKVRKGSLPVFNSTAAPRQALTRDQLISRLDFSAISQENLKFIAVKIIKNIGFHDAESHHVQLIEENPVYCEIVLRVNADVDRITGCLEEGSSKRGNTEAAAQDFKYEYLNAITDHMDNHQPSGPTMEQAVKKFDEVLAKDTNKSGRVMLSALVNFITHALAPFTLGASLAFNYRNKQKTGDWLLFSRPKSSERLYESVSNLPEASPAA